MKRLFAAALLGSLSLSACAQPAAPVANAADPVSEPAVAEAKVAPGSAEERVRNALHGIDKRIVVERIGPAPMPGFREVVAGGMVLYVSDDGKYLLQGALMDIPGRRDLTEQAMARQRVEILKTLPVADRIVFPAKGEKKHSVVVLTDVECGYCRKMHNEIAEINARGIEVQYLAFPRAGLGSDDYRKMVSVWCADDRRKALTDAKNGRPVPPRTCKTPVDMQYAAGKRMGLEGTPMVLSEDGRQLGGYLPPAALEIRLEEVAAERAMAGKGAGGI